MKKKNILRKVILVAGIVGSSVALASCNGELVPTQTTTPTTTDTTPAPTTTVEPTTTTPVVPTTTTSEAPSVFTVTFDPMNGVNQPRGVEVNDGETVTAAPASSKEPTEHVRYTFAGWYTSTDGGTTLSAEPFDFATPITANITLYAKYNVTEIVTVTFIPLNGDGIVSVTIDKGEKLVASDFSEPEFETYTFGGWYTSTDEGVTLSDTAFNLDTAIDSDLTLYAKWNSVEAYEGYVRINTAEDFINFRKDDKNKDKNVVLTHDIDLAGITLADSNVKEFAGIFDGNGHIIKNANFRVTNNKTGLIFKSIIGGSVKNLKFSTCTIDAASQQGVGLIVGLIGGNAKFEDLEFSACNVLNGSSYVGLIGGELGETTTKTGTVNVDRITVKNQTRVATSQYGGLLFGDINGPFTIVSSDLDVEGTLVSSGNGSFVFGRVRPTTSITLRNSIIKANTADKNNILLTNAQKANDCIFENVVVITDNKLEPRGASDTNTGKTITYTNFYTTGDNNVGGDSAKGLIAGTTKIEKSVVTLDWLKETLHLDFGADGAWVEESDGSYRLKSASSNVRAADAHITNIMVATAAAKTRYKLGEEADTTGLIILATFNNGTQLVVPHDEFNIDFSAVDFNTAGNYVVTVSEKANPEVSAEFNVVVAQNDGWTMIDQFVTKEYLVGSKLDLANLRVYSLWSDDGKEEIAQNKSGETAGYNLDLSEVDMNMIGEQTITLTFKDFEPFTIKINVHAAAPEIINGYVYVNVDGAQEEQAKVVKGVNTFNNLTNAIDYLEACKLSDSVVKVVYLADGTYYEKINTSLNNLHLVGESKDNTIITYSAVESTVSPLTNAPYGLNTDDCATVHINGKGFAATNLQIRNDFDYLENMTTKAESDPQGLALTINGDGAVLSNVLLHGNQDTLFLKSGRAYFKCCTIEGNVDFIFGENSGVGLFDTCTIKALNRGATNKQTGYVTAMRATSENAPTYGYVFLNCNLTADELVGDGTMALGRPWGEKATVAYISCTFSKAYSTLAYEEGIKISRWFAMSAALPQNANYVEYDSKGEGAITEEVFGGKILTAAQAANYTLANILSNTNGNVRFTDSFNFPQILADLEEEATKVDATGIWSLSPVEVSIGSSVKIEAYVEPWNASDRSFTITPDNSGVYEYDADFGTITGLTEGTGTLLISQGTVTKEVTVNVSAKELFTVKFDTKGGTAVADQNVVEDGKVDATKTATTKEGAVFKGWYTDDKFENKFDLGTDTVSSNLVLYARFVKWADMYKENVTLYFNGTEGDGLNTFKYDNTDQTAGTYYGITVTGKFIARASDVQYNNNVTASINVAKNAKVALSVLDLKGTTITFKLNGTTVTPKVVDGGNNKAYTYIVEAAEDGVLSFANSGANCYLGSLQVSYPVIIDESLRVDFGTDGDYTEQSLIDLSGATYGQIQAKCNQIAKDSEIVFYVVPGSKIHISGNWSVGYSINGTQVLTSQAGGADDKGLEYTYECVDGGKVVIKSLHNNNYFYYISVTVPTIIAESARVDFGSDGDYTTQKLIDLSGAAYGQIQAACNQIKKDSKVVLYVLPGSKIHISGNWSVGYSINGTQVLTTNAGGTDNTGLEYTYTSVEGGRIEIVSLHDNNYFYYISVTVPTVITEATRIDFGTNGDYTEKTMFDLSGAEYGQIQGACNQIKKDSEIVFYVAPHAEIHISGNWSVGYDINGTQVLTTQAGGSDDSGLEYTYQCVEGGRVVINAHHNNNYIYYISVSYPTYVLESTRVDFGTDGDYEEKTMFDLSGATYGQIQAKCNQIAKDSEIVFYVVPGAKIHISGNWSVAYSINGVEVVTSQAGGTDDTGLEYTYTCAEGGRIVIKSLHNNNYIYYISVTNPTVIKDDCKIDFGTEGDYTTKTMFDLSGAEYGQIQAKCNQVKKDSEIVFFVEAGAKNHISGNWSVGYSINGTEVLTSNAGGTDDTGLDYTYTCAEGGKVVIKSLHNNNYFYFIEVKY